MSSEDLIKVIVVILLLPVGLYLREQAYRNLHGNGTMWNDFCNLCSTITRWLKRTFNNK